MTRSLLLLFVLGACDGEAEGVHITPLQLRPPAADAHLAIAGQVVDDGGAPVPDVHVRMRGDVVREVVTDGGGRFAFTGLFAGTYSVGVLERVAGKPSGIRPVGPASLTVSIPDPAARYLQLVVHRVAAISSRTPT